MPGSPFPLITLPPNTVAGNGASDAEPPSAIPFATLAALLASYLTDTSASSVTIGSGNKTFQISTGKAFQAGMILTVASGVNYMTGTVVSYDPALGVLVLNSTGTGGSGTFASWTVTLSGEPGGTGSTGAAGPGFPNVKHTYSATNTAPSADASAKIDLGGNALYNFAFGTANTYPSGYIAIVTNIDSNRGKFIFPNGLPSFILWPGQSCRLYLNAAGTAWLVDPAFQRWTYPAGTVIQVSTSGNDSTGDGLGSPFATIQHACNVINDNFDSSNGTITIQLADGTYNEAVFVAGQPGAGTDQINIMGNGTTPTNTKVAAPTGQFAFGVRDYGIFTLNFLEVFMSGSTSGGGGVQASQFATIDLNNVTFGGCPNGTLVLAQDGGHVNLTGGIHIAGNSAVMFNAAGAGSMIIPNNPIIFDIAVNFASGVFVASDLGSIRAEGNLSFGSPGNCTGPSYIISGNAVIDRSGQTIPGSAGTITSGGQLI